MSKRETANDPRELQTMNPGANEIRSVPKSSSDKVQMKKQLGLLEGVAIILGIILGSGTNSFLLFTDSKMPYR